MASWSKLLGRIHRGSIMERRTQRIAEAISLLPIAGAKILDVGCGNGMLAQNIMRLRPDVYIEGVDILEWPNPSIPVRLFDGESIPADSGEWDYCLVSDVLHHCTAPEEFLCEIVRVSGKGFILKDHLAETRWDRAVLSFMDWFGNFGHGVELTYNYWSWHRWEAEFSRNGVVPKLVQNRLSLYPFPFCTMFDRNLHFLSLLEKDKCQGTESLHSIGTEIERLPP